MTTTLVFCTSDKVTPELIRELQAADAECPVPSPYMPACHDATRPHKPSRTEIEDIVEVFDGVTDEALQQLTQERSEERNWLHNTIFLVLDERSTLDKTVLLNANRTLYGPCWEKIDGEDVDKEPEVISDGWWTWRIKFDACFKMIGLLDLKPEFEQEVFLKEKERFTNAEGVFDSKGALDWYCDPGRRNGDGPG